MIYTHVLSYLSRSSVKERRYNDRAKFVAALALAGACMLAGCGSNDVYTGEPKVRDRVILPTPVVMPQPAVAVIGDVAVLIPFVARVRVNANVERGKRIKTALSTEGFVVENEFQQNLASELKKVGASDVSTVSIQRAPPKDFAVWPDERELPQGSPTECFMDVQLNYGFVAPVTGADYKPYMVVNLKVVRGEDHYVSHEEKFSYNFLGKGVEVTPTAPLASWKNGAAVEADVSGARHALDAAVGDLSRFISSHLQANDQLGKC